MMLLLQSSHTSNDDVAFGEWLA